ncbi:MAG: protein translocase subunit SecD, partial [Methylophaga nitratireducenticrescens]
MNRYPLWKNLLVVAVIVIAIIYAMPNLFGDDPAVQVSASRQNTVDLQLANEIESTLKQAEIPYKGVVLEENRLLIRFSEANDQLKARELIQQSLSADDYIVALNLAPNTPPLLRSLGAKPMNLGLDLRGGVHFLMEVDMDTV